MHEFAVCQDMLHQIESIAAEQQASAVDSITLRIGPLSGVEAHLLSQAFPLAAAGTVQQVETAVAVGAVGITGG